MKNDIALLSFALTLAAVVAVPVHSQNTPNAPATPSAPMTPSVRSLTALPTPIPVPNGPVDARATPSSGTIDPSQVGMMGTNTTGSQVKGSNVTGTVSSDTARTDRRNQSTQTGLPENITGSSMGIGTNGGTATGPMGGDGSGLGTSGGAR